MRHCRAAVGGEPCSCGEPPPARLRCRATGALSLACPHCRWPAFRVPGLLTLVLPCLHEGTTSTGTTRSWACSPSKHVKRLLQTGPAAAQHGTCGTVAKQQRRHPACGALWHAAWRRQPGPAQPDCTCCGAFVKHVYNIRCLPAAPARAAAIHHLISTPSRQPHPQFCYLIHRPTLQLASGTQQQQQQAHCLPCPLPAPRLAPTNPLAFNPARSCAIVAV